MAYNSVSKLRNNVEAIRIALEWDGKRRLNPAELSTLRGYSGFGGLKGILYGDSSLEEWKEAGASETDQKLHTEFMKLFEVLDLNLTGRERKTVLESLKNSILTAFYTPAVVPRTFFDVLKSFTDVKTMYEPSAGAGVFIDEALKIFNLDSVRAYEKDLLTGKVLTTSLYSNPASPVFTKVHIQGFEESGGKEDYDLITSNIPFGAFAVYDPAITDRNLTSKIHNYFFAKGLQKIKDHGILAYLVTDTFLNTVSNKSAREHLFMNADFISLTVLPDMLMKETANTEAPSHFLVVRKNTGKTQLSDDEHLLVESQLMNFDGKMIATNNYVYAFGHECTIGDITVGKNQYGKPAREITFKGTEAELESRFRDILLFDFKRRFVMRYEDLKIPVAVAEEFKTKPDVQIVKAVDHIPDHEYDQETTEEAKAQQEDLSDSQEVMYVPRDAEEGGPEQTHFEDDDVPVAMADKIFTDETVPFKPMVIVKWEGALMRVSSIGEDGNNVAMALADLVTDREKEIMEMYIRVRDAYYVIDQHEKVFESNHAVMRGKLKTAYDEFVEIFGAMNKTRNKNIILKDVYGFLILASVEIKNGTNDFSPADVLTKSSKGETEVFKTQHSAEALAYCLAMIGRVDLRFISEITDKEEEAIIDELGELIYINPTTLLWETADRYLSGNVYRKMVEADRAYNNRESDNPQLKRSLDAITEVQPEKIPFELLEFNLGERWIPLYYYDRFADWLFEMKHPSKVKIIYFPAVDVFKTEMEGSYSPKMSREYFVSPKGNNGNLYGHDLLEHALENTAPFFTYTQGDQRVPDNDAIQLANDKIETIRTKFREWLSELDMDEKNNLVDIYNNTYNCYVLRKYDGSHMLFPGLDLSKLGRNETPIPGLYDSQKDTAWRILQDNGAIVDHEVGTGKTLIMVVTSYEMKRMGIRRKPCILALKANIADIVKTYRRAYPHARILAPSETDFEKANRARLFHEMKNNDWDCVIMTHDQFGKIPQSPEIQTEILEEELGNLDRDLDSLQGAGWSVSRTMRKGLEGKKANLEAKLQSIRDKVDKNKDKDIDFEEMGIDHLFIDEAHMFKNLTFTTRHDRVAGLGNTEGSQKALNMLFAIRTLQRRFNADIQTTFLSGTPISNSLTEMYLLFKYLRPKELAKQNILNFDAWAAVFAKKTTDFEFSVTNQIIAKERFRHFIKVPELALFYNEIADYRTNKSINIDRPELHEELVALPPTPEQQEFTRNLISFAKTGNGDYIGIGKLTEKQDKARMLIATNYAKKMSTDMRLINPYMYDDHPDNKISVCCRKVKEFYVKFEEHKGTQLIFCDLGTPKPNEWNVYDEIRKKLVEEHGIPTEEIAFIHDYNERTRRVLFEKMNAGIIRVLVGSTSKAGTGLNVQERVVATHDLDIPWKPAELEQRGGRGARQGNWLAKMHQGNIVYRFIYATEQSLDNYKFTLLKNKQTFISQMKKNELSVRSIDEGSIDEQSGMNFAEYIAVLSGDTTLLEKAKIDKKLAVLENLRSAHYREQSQNKYILAHREERLEEVEGMLVTLQRDYDLYSSQLTRDETGTKNNPIEIFALKEKLIELEKERLVEEEEIRKIKEELKKKKELFKDGEISEEELLEAEVQKTRAKPRVKEAAVVIGEYMVDAFKNWKPKPGSGDIYAKIGTLYGFNLYVERTTNHDSSDTIRRAYTGDGNNITFSNRLYARHPEGGLKYYFNHGEPSRDNMKIAARNYLNAIDRCGSILEDYNEQKSKLDYTIAALKSMEDREFGKETEIANLREESKRLEREIKIAIEKSKHAEEQVDEKDKKKSKAKAKA